MNRKNEDGGALLEREQYKYRRWGSGGITGGQGIFRTFFYLFLI